MTATGPRPIHTRWASRVLNVLRVLASSGPLLVAVDDVQWLDSASSSGLGYAARRLRGEPVGLLARAPHGSSRARSPDELPPLALPRSATARSRSGRWTSLRCTTSCRVTWGSFFAAAARGGARRGGRQPVLRAGARPHTSTQGRFGRGRPSRFRCRSRCTDLVLARLHALPLESREFLVAAAAHADDRRDHRGGVGARRDAGVPPLSRHGRRAQRRPLRFTHPLLPSARTRRPTQGSGGRCTRGLRGLLDDPEARAWQLAGATRSRRACSRACSRKRHSGRGAEARRGPPRSCSSAPRELTPTTVRTRLCGRLRPGRIALRVRGLRRAEISYGPPSIARRRVGRGLGFGSAACIAPTRHRTKRLRSSSFLIEAEDWSFSPAHMKGGCVVVLWPLERLGDAAGARGGGLGPRVELEDDGLVATAAAAGSGPRAWL